MAPVQRIILRLSMRYAPPDNVVSYCWPLANARRERWRLVNTPLIARWRRVAFYPVQA